MSEWYGEHPAVVRERTVPTRPDALGEPESEGEVSPGEETAAEE
jgi:hypothetical protein